MEDKKITLKMINKLIRELSYEDRKKLYYLLKGAKLNKDYEFKDFK